MLKAPKTTLWVLNGTWLEVTYHVPRDVVIRSMFHAFVSAGLHRDLGAPQWRCRGKCVLYLLASHPC